jgi:hypothetical protein
MSLGVSGMGNADLAEARHKIWENETVQELVEALHSDPDELTDNDLVRIMEGHVDVVSLQDYREAYRIWRIRRDYAEDYQVTQFVPYVAHIAPLPTPAWTAKRVVQAMRKPGNKPIPQGSRLFE